MALLLAMYQKMRLIREKNQATYDLTKFSSKYDRVSKNIERVQKMYTGRLAKLDQQKQLMLSRAKSIFLQNYGLAGVANNSAYINPQSPYGAQNAFTASRLQYYVQNGIPVEIVDGKVQATEDGKPKPFDYAAELYQLYAQGKLNPKALPDENTNKDTHVEVTLPNGTTTEIPKDSLTLFQQAVNAAQNDYQQANMLNNQANINYESNVTIWYEAQKAQMEEEQDAALAPLNYQQTMWELEKEQAEQKLTRIKEELQSYTQLCSEEAKEQAPKFGLG